VAFFEREFEQLIADLNDEGDRGIERVDGALADHFEFAFWQGIDCPGDFLDGDDGGNRFGRRGGDCLSCRGAEFQQAFGFRLR